MDITWLGHSCFQIKGKDVVVITDPCHPDLGYALSNLQADIVTVSHFHPGHCYTEAVTSEYRAIEGPGEYELRGVFITGIATFHDADRGKSRGKNTVYVAEMDGVTLCHLGDLGHLPSSELMEDMANIDVLFIPVGGISTLSAPAAAELTKRLAPKIVIPMHYKTPVLSVELEPVDKFLKELNVVGTDPKPKLVVNRSNLPVGTQITVLDYPHS